jgi:hypothetical protein
MSLRGSRIDSEVGVYKGPAEAHGVIVAR